MTSRTSQRTSGDARVAKVSVVIPVRDEADSIATLISSIESQTRKPEEVVIVDGGSRDGTPELVRSIVGADPRYQIIEAGTATPGRGRNVGTLVSRCPWVAFTDAGIELDARWLERMTAAAESHPSAEVVFGTYDPRIRSFFDSCAVGAYVQALHGSPPVAGRGPSVASMMITRAALDRANGFPDFRAAEDLVFFERLQEAGVSATWAPDAVVHWEVAPSMLATFRRFRLYSRQNALIGRQRKWHYGVARLYGAAAVIAALGLTRKKPILLILPAAAWARGAHNLWKHRSQYGLRFVVNPLRVACVVALTVLIDVAMFAGWTEASLRRFRIRLSGV